MVRSIVRILIVDDDEHVAAGLRMALTLRGFEAATCTTAEEALERLAAEPWALVIADLRLPSMDGQELLRHVAEVQPAARRILITGFGTPETELWARQEVDDCLTKPFTSQCLLQAVQRLLPAAPAQEFDESGASNAGGP